eukprot:gene1249-11027_t
MAMLLLSIHEATALFDGRPSYSVTGAGESIANGVYYRTQQNENSYASNAGWQLFLYEEKCVMYRSNGKWYIGPAGEKAYYVTTCDSSVLPPSRSGWINSTAGGGSSDGGATPQYPLGSCEPIIPPPAHPHPSCSTPQCDAIWGPTGCPDLNAYKPDLVRPPMETGVAPAAGKRVRAVAPGFEDWTEVRNTTAATNSGGSGSSSRRKNGGAKKYPVIVEYMGNGPFNDKVGDVSTGRPEDSNLGWGMAEPAGSQYIWISMPFLSSWLGADTEISTYWCEAALEARWTRLAGRPTLYLGECDVATAGGPAWLQKIGQNGTKARKDLHAAVAQEAICISGHATQDFKYDISYKRSIRKRAASGMVGQQAW